MFIEEVVGLVGLQDLVAKHSALDSAYLHNRAVPFDCVGAAHMLGLQSNRVWTLLSIFEDQGVAVLLGFVVG